VDVDDYYEGVVMQYLRADPSMFVRPQGCIQLDEGLSGASAGRHWYCDILAIRLRRPETVLLCEVTFAEVPKALFNRLSAWDETWSLVRKALARDSGVPHDWPVQPWVFVREKRVEYVRQRLATRLGPRAVGGMPMPLVTGLDEVTPWNYAAPLCLPPEGCTPDSRS
jgi:hypothetical protein